MDYVGDEAFEVILCGNGDVHKRGQQGRGVASSSKLKAQSSKGIEAGMGQGPMAP